MKPFFKSEVPKAPNPPKARKFEDFPISKEFDDFEDTDLPKSLKSLAACIKKLAFNVMHITSQALSGDYPDSDFVQYMVYQLRDECPDIGLQSDMEDVIESLIVNNLLDSERVNYIRGRWDTLICEAQNYSNEIFNTKQYIDEQTNILLSEFCEQHPGERYNFFGYMQREISYPKASKQSIEVFFERYHNIHSNHFFDGPWYKFSFIVDSFVKLLSKLHNTLCKYITKTGDAPASQEANGDRGGKSTEEICETPNQQLSNRATKAWDEYQEAIAKGKFDSSPPKDKDVYSWLLVHEQKSKDLPKLNTWQRYLREARKFHGLQKNTRRGGRATGSSIDTETGNKPISVSERERRIKRSINQTD